MGRKPDLQIKIDGQSVLPSAVDRHFQADPHPGGHHYELRILGPGAREVLSDLPREGTVIPTTAETERILHVDLLAAFGSHWEGRRRVDYLLNQIASIEVDADSVLLTGECSRVVR